MTDLRVSLGSANGDGRQHITYRFGDRVYPDAVDLSSGFQREQSMKRALEALGLPVENLAALGAEVTRLAEEKKRTAPIEFRRISFAELAAGSYELEYLIDGALVSGQPCIMAGGKKCLKTSILIDMGISLAMGGCFLGRLKVNRGCRVGIMTAESGLGTIQETALRIAAAAGYTDVPGLVFSEDVPQFANLLHLDALRRFIDGDELEVLAIDPAYMCLPDVDHANLFQVGDVLRGISRLCQETGVTLLICHHTRKGKADPFSAPELEDIAWAGFQEFARQWLLVGRRELYQPGTGEHRLWLSAGGSAGHSSLWALDIDEGTRETPGGRFWRVEIKRADEARQEADTRQEEQRQHRAEKKAAAAVDGDRKAIVAVIAKLTSPDTKREISGRFVGGWTRFNRAFNSLVDDGTIRKVNLTKGRGSHSYDAWRLRNDDET